MPSSSTEVPGTIIHCHGLSFHRQRFHLAFLVSRHLKCSLICCREPPHGGLVAQRAAQIQRHQQQQRQQQQPSSSSFFGSFNALNNIAQQAKDSFKSSREASAARGTSKTMQEGPASDSKASHQGPAAALSAPSK